MAVRLMRLNRQAGILLFLAMAGAALVPSTYAATCTTQSQMAATDRSSLTNTARAMVNQVRSGDVAGLRASTIPSVAANFDGIAASVKTLQPNVQSATITIDDLYLLDASTDTASQAQTNFYCGAPLVVINFNNLPPGKYALVIVHATGVPKPQQISLILSETSPNRWLLAGFFSNSMLEAGHTGLWYWTQARYFAQKKMNWNAWLYYQIAASLLQPVPFLSSPNLVKLHQEADQIRPPDFPGSTPMALNAGASTFSVRTVGISTEFGGLDLEVRYVPNAAQLAELSQPVAARKQAIQVMTALLERHPDLRAAFHGVWVQAEQGSASIYALELPMDQIAATAGAPPPVAAPGPK